MASTTTGPTRVQHRPRRRSQPWQVCGGGLTSAAAGLAAVELYAVSIRAAGVPMRAGTLGAHAAQPVTAGSFATGIVVCAFWGTVIALAAARYARRPVRTFTVVAVTLTAVSLIVPIGAGDTALETKVALAAAHVLAATIMIPLMARSMRDPRAAG